MGAFFRFGLIEMKLHSLICFQTQSSMKPVILLFLSFFTLIGSSQAQIGIADVEYLEDLKNGTTYVVSRGYDSDAMELYRMAFIRHWTYSPISFISSSEIDEYAQPGNSFIYLGGYDKTMTFTTVDSRTGAEVSSMTAEANHPQMELRLIIERDNPRRGEERIDDIQVAFLELHTDFVTVMNLKILRRQNLSGGGHIRGWGPGVLTNKIQQMSVLLEEGEINKYYKPETDETQLINLQSQPILIPDYCLIYFEPTTGDEDEVKEESDLMSGYQYPYEIVTTEELNERILSEEQVYYLHYVKIVGNKYIEVVNSQTGEIIYSQAKNLSYNIKGKDLEALSKAVRKAR